MAGKVLGVTSIIEHGSKFATAYNNGNEVGMLINGSKLILDGVFLFVKSTNPVFLGASVVYGTIDCLTSDY